MKLSRTRHMDLLYTFTTCYLVGFWRSEWDQHVTNQMPPVSIANLIGAGEARYICLYAYICSTYPYPLNIVVRPNAAYTCRAVMECSEGLDRTERGRKEILNHEQYLNKRSDSLRSPGYATRLPHPTHDTTRIPTLWFALASGLGEGVMRKPEFIIRAVR
ncbi:hypothetical protein F5Y14DRAFT_49012 [Nemania sp. NC0429]|nr:hypothetical protein F5Y14DRAFT_49012 [Nemania sp. NC0429]